MRDALKPLALAALGALAACGDEDTPSETGISADACAARGVDACEDDGLCRTIDGRSLLDDGVGGVCADYSVAPEPLGCMPASYACTAAITYAAPPDDPSNCWEFSAGCVPEDWVSCAEPTSTCR